MEDAVASPGNSASSRGMPRKPVLQNAALRSAAACVGRVAPSARVRTNAKRARGRERAHRRGERGPRRNDSPPLLSTLTMDANGVHPADDRVQRVLAPWPICENAQPSSTRGHHEEQAAEERGDGFRHGGALTNTRASTTTTPKPRTLTLTLTLAA